jgi:hypothetical protein
LPEFHLCSTTPSSLPAPRHQEIVIPSAAEGPAFALSP